MILGYCLRPPIEAGKQHLHRKLFASALVKPIIEALLNVGALPDRVIA
jgi:hypothetical protein